MSLRRLAWILVLAVFAAFFFFPSLLGLLVDWWWFQEIGYQVVFTRELVTRLLLFLIVGGLSFGVLYLNLRMAQRGLVPYPVVLRFTQAAPRIDLSTPLRRLTLPVSLFLGLMAGLAGIPAWDLVLRLLYRTPFGIKDPVFSRDIGFYVFTLPGITAGLGFLSALLVISLILLLPVYVLRGDIIPGVGPRKALRLESSPRRGCTSHPCSRRSFSSPRSGSGWWTFPACSIPPPARWSAPATPTCTPGCRRCGSRRSWRCWPPSWS